MFWRRPAKVSDFNNSAFTAVNCAFELSCLLKAADHKCVPLSFIRLGKVHFSYVNGDKGRWHLLVGGQGVNQKFQDQHELGQILTTTDDWEVISQYFNGEPLDDDPSIIRITDNKKELPPTINFDDNSGNVTPVSIENAIKQLESFTVLKDVR